MPRVIIRTKRSAPRWAEAADAASQSIYENTNIPYLDVKKGVESVQPQPIVENNTPCCEVPREVPYYAEEEALPEPVPEAIVPDLEAEVGQYFPTSRTMPPPPPASAPSVQAMLFWYRRLLACPVYSACCQLVRMDCPAPPSDAVSVAVWVDCCSQWWEAVNAVLQENGAAFKVPELRTWNPYSFECSEKYHSNMQSQTSQLADVSVARFPVPPPPSYELVLEEYAQYMAPRDAEAVYQGLLAGWWRRACQWSAAMNRRCSWVCSPPSTGASTAEWSRRCALWCAITLAELKNEREKDHRPQPSIFPSPRATQQQRLCERSPLDAKQLW